MKVTTAISIDLDLVKWIENEMKSGRFANKSHGINYCVKTVRDRKII